MATTLSTNSQKLQDYTKAFEKASVESYKNFDYQNNSFKVETLTSTSPHYEVPNLSSMLYEYTNKEQDRVIKTFRVGNFYSLRDLPNEMIAGNVLNAQKEKIERNLNG